jgi:hypothetical protein
MKKNIFRRAGFTSSKMSASAEAMAMHMPTVRLLVILFNHINHNAYKNQ